MVVVVCVCCTSADDVREVGVSGGAYNNVSFMVVVGVSVTVVIGIYVLGDGVNVIVVGIYVSVVF